MRFISLFAGIGGFDLGLEQAGHECAGQIEIDPFCRRVLGERFNASRWTDVREWQGYGDECLDLLVGGFPCQDLSVAGKRGGLKAARSGLFWEIVRIAKIIRPTWGLFENVPGLLSSQRGADMSSVIRGLRECWPVVGWRILDSRHFGVAQRRRRVFFVCGPTEARVRAVLFEPEGGGGHSSAGEQAGTGVATSLTSGIGAASNNPDRRREDDVNLIVARAVARGSIGSGYRYDANGEDFVIGINASGLRGRQPGSAASFVFEPKASAHQSMNPSPLAPALGTSKEPAVFGSSVAIPLDLRNASRTTDPSEMNRQGLGVGQDGDPSPSLTDVFTPGVAGAFGVRRLTPLECERLQGFPDGWTCLCQPIEAYRDDPDEAAMRCKCPDSPRYRALGNAVTVNVIEWMGRRLHRVVHMQG